MKNCKYFIWLIAVLVMVSGCEEIISEEDISTESIELLAPLNNTVVSTSNVNFNWTALQDSLSYRVQVAMPSFSEAQQLVIDSVVTNTGISKTLSDGNYQWRVQGFNSAYETPFTTAGFEVSAE